MSAAIALILVLILWIVLSKRARKIEGRILSFERRLVLLEDRLERPGREAAPERVPRPAGPAPKEAPPARPPPVAAPRPVPAAAAPPPPTPPVPAAPGVFERLRATLPKVDEAAEWEVLVGGSWLNKVGIIVLVVGVALLLGYSLRYYGPLGRVLTGAGAGLGLLVIGVLLERRTLYRLFARPVIGGGWAILYFTAFAAHNLDAAKVVYEPEKALLLMALVALGIILHAYRYRSQLFTAFAYGLAYLAVVISPITTFSLAAIALLAASLVALLRVLPWYHLAVVAVVGTYVSQFIWLGQGPAEFPGLMERLGAAPALAAGESFWVSQGVLALYWVLFVVAAFVRKPAGGRDDRLLVSLNAGNTLGFLALSAWGLWTAFPEQMHVLTAAAAIAYMATAYLFWVSRKEDLFLFNATVAVLLVAVTFPLALRTWTVDHEWLAVYWAVEAAIVFALGFRLRRAPLRIESYALCGASLVALFAINLYGVPEGRHALTWLTVPPVIAFFLYLFDRLEWSAGRPDILPGARTLGTAFGYAAAALLARLFWQEVPHVLVGVAWLAMGLLWFEAGAWAGRPHLRGPGYALCALAAGALALVNLYEVVGQGEALQPLPRWVIVGTAGLAFYYLFWRLTNEAGRARLHPQESRFTEAPSYVATAILSVLLWKELGAVAVSLAWAVYGVALFEAGGLTGWRALRLQGHALLGAAFVRLFMANFTSLGETFGVSHRLITVLPVVATFYYLLMRVREEVAQGTELRTERNLDAVYSYGAVLLLAVLFRFELGRAYTVLAWAPLMLVFLVIGVLWRERHFRFQAHILALATFFRSWATNIYLIGSFYGIPERYATTVPVVVAFFAAALFSIRTRAVFATEDVVREARGRWHRLLARLDRHAGALYAMLGPGLVTVLLYYEVSGNVLTIAWTAEAFVVLGIGFLLVERGFRLYGLALLFVCLVKLVVFDLQEVEMLYRIFSYIVLGIILLLTSFAYTKYWTAIRRYL